MRYSCALKFIAEVAMVMNRIDLRVVKPTTRMGPATGILVPEIVIRLGRNGQAILVGQCIPT
jgi:hypothetical protein